MPVAIGLRTAHSAPWDGAIIDIAAVSMSLDGELLGSYHRYIQADDHRAYRFAALKSAKVAYKFLEEEGVEEAAAFAEWLDYIEKYAGFAPVWVGGADRFDGREQVTFLQKRLFNLDRMRGLPHTLILEDASRAVIELDLAPPMDYAPSYAATQWVGYEPPLASDSALDRAVATAKAAAVLSGHLTNIRAAMRAHGENK